LEHICFYSRSEIGQKRISSRNAYVVKRSFAIGSPTMPNVMLE
jgi:hypothetical protein